MHQAFGGAAPQIIESVPFENKFAASLLKIKRQIKKE